MFAPALTHRGPEMRVMLGLCVFGFIFVSLSFWSDCWWYTFNPGNRFRRAGPWIFCFDGYIWPRDYRNKIYNGCWYVFVKEFRWLMELLEPGWFIFVQVCEGIVYLCNGVAMMIVLVTYLREYSIPDCYLRMQRAFAFKAVETICQRLSLFSPKIPHFFVLFSSLLVMALIVFGDGATRDWEWMPLRMDNLFGWGFGLAIIANVAALSCLVPLWLYMLRLRARIQQFLIDEDLMSVKVTAGLPEKSVLSTMPETKPLRPYTEEDEEEAAYQD